jgi:hypothetical protein
VGHDEQLAALADIDRALGSEDVDVWLFGGWAVDFHVGEITRPHGDLDVAIWAADRERAGELLVADGWTHAPEPGEDGSTAYARDDVTVEIAFLARDEATGEVYTPIRAGRAGWAPGSFGDDVRELRGVRARVIARDALKVEKSPAAGDEPAKAAKDRADLATLERRG